MTVYPLDHIAICVQDMDQATQFYQELGLSMTYKTRDMAYFHNGNHGLVLVREGSKDAKPHFGFHCPSPEAVQKQHAELHDQGIHVTPIQTIGDFISFYAQDPSGNWFEYLYEPSSVSTPSSESQTITNRKKSAQRLTTHKKPKGFAVL